MTNLSLICQLSERFSGDSLIVLTAFGVVFSIVSVVGNGIIILAFATTPSLHKPSYLLLTNLSLSDLLFGLVGFPIYVVPDFVQGILCNVDFYTARVFTVYLLINMQLNNIMAIAVERCIGVHFPYFYKEHVTMLRTAVATGFTWLFGITRALVLSLLYKTNLNLGLTIEAPMVVIFVVASFVIYCKVYFVSRQHLRTDERYGIRNRESKSQVAVQIAVINFIAWMPVIFVTPLAALGVNTSYWKQLTFLSPFVCTCFNLGIYTYRMKDYREGVRRLMGRNSTVVPAPERSN